MSSGLKRSLAAGLALTARDGAERVEPAGDGREEALLGLHVRGDRPEQRRLRLVGAVRPPQALDRGVGLPAGFEQIVDAQPAVPRRQFGVVAAPGAARLRKDQDALQVIHEGGGLGEVGGGRAVLDDEAVTLAHHAARASGHFGDEVRAEALDDLVERAGNGRQRSQPLDQLIAAGDGLAALDGLAVSEDGPGREVALAVGERLVELHREANERGSREHTRAA